MYDTGAYTLWASQVHRSDIIISDDISEDNVSWIM